MREWFNIKDVNFIIYSVDFSFPFELFCLNTTLYMFTDETTDPRDFLMLLQCYTFP